MIIINDNNKIIDNINYYYIFMLVWFQHLELKDDQACVDK